MPSSSISTANASSSSEAEILKLLKLKGEEFLGSFKDGTVSKPVRGKRDKGKAKEKDESMTNGVDKSGEVKKKKRKLAEKEIEDIAGMPSTSKSKRTTTLSPSSHLKSKPKLGSQPSTRSAQIVTFQDPIASLGSSSSHAIEEKRERKKFLASKMKNLLDIPPSDSEEDALSKKRQKLSSKEIEDKAQEAELSKLDSELSDLLSLPTSSVSLPTLLSIASPAPVVPISTPLKQTHSRKILRLSTSANLKRSKLVDSKNGVDERGGGEKKAKSLREKRKEEEEGRKGRSVRRRVGGGEKGERERRGLRLGRVGREGGRVRMGRDGVMRVKGVKG